MIFSYKQKTIFIIAFFLLILDRLAKMTALKIWATNDIQLFSWLKLSFGLNENIAFSLPLSGLFLKALLIIIILILAYYWLFFIKKAQSWPTLLLTVLLLNAINNTLDRFVYGGVIDYISVKYFTILNLADISICLSALALAIYFHKHRTLNKTTSRILND